MLNRSRVSESNRPNKKAKRVTVLDLFSVPLIPGMAVPFTSRPMECHERATAYGRMCGTQSSDVGMVTCRRWVSFPEHLDAILLGSFRETFGRAFSHQECRYQNGQADAWGRMTCGSHHPKTGGRSKARGPPQGRESRLSGGNCWLLRRQSSFRFGG